jgi:hypothetical protein
VHSLINHRRRQPEIGRKNASTGVVLIVTR